ncbi:MAG: tyrosine-type recombinase/integrase [Chloroflexi bacterium]|nr:tyrosine-type recombinase/integrase [Chloroflexota bacterium]
MDELAQGETQADPDQMLRLEDELDRFLVALAAAENYARNTVSAYRNDLSQLVDWLKQRQPPVSAWPEVSTEVLGEFVEHLRSMQVIKRRGTVKPVAASTVARKIAAIKSFFNYLAASHAIEVDAAIGLETPKIAKRTPKTMTSADVERLLSAPGGGNSPKVLRDHALLELLYATGMRVSELVALQLGDIDLAAECVYVRGHAGGQAGGKERQVPISAAAVSAVRVYVERGRLGLIKSEPAPMALFLNQRGQSLTRQGMWLIIKEYAARAGLHFEVTPHILRHSFAAHMLLENKASLADIQRRLGHANISTTQIYMQPIAVDANPETALAVEVESPLTAEL